MKTIKLLSQLSVLLLLFACSGATSVKEEKSPNIIFILTDDQGWTHTSHRADPNIPESKSDYFETPNMDKLAKSGVMFTQGYAPNPICSPTRNSLMFGQNAARHIYNKDADWYKKTADWLTLPKAVKMGNPDYRTAHFGKWHIAKVPKDAGFDYDDGMTSNGGGEIFGDGFLNAKDYTKPAEKYLVENEIPNPTNAKKVGKPSAYWSDKNPKDIFGITARAKKFMKESIDKGKPFFVQLSHFATHLSLVSQKETYEYFKNKEKGERHTNAEFAAMLKDLDTGVGMIMDFVKEQGIEDNTYIFLMGDNGGRLSLNQIAVIDENRELVEADYSTQHNRNIPLRDGKHSFYEGGLRVPFMVVGPDIKSGRVCRTPVTGLDFLPTFAELAGYSGDMPEYLDGGSMVSILKDEKIERVERNSESLIFHQSSHRKPRSAIRKGDMKLIKYWSRETKYKNTPKVELFDISKDLSESNNLASKYPDKVKELETELVKFLDDVNAETGIRKIDGAFYRLKDDLSIAQPFNLQCNGKTISVNEQNDVPLSYGYSTYKYARVTYTGKPLLMEIAASGFEFEDSDWDISPHSYGIKGEKTENKLSFTIDRTGYLVVRFKKDQDFTKRLVILVEPPEELPQGELVDVVNTYKIDNTGAKNETEKIQQALDDISGSGKILYFPEGLYKSFGLSIKKNSRIHLAKNSRIIADGRDIEKYIDIDDVGMRRFILIKDAQNIQVTGLGAFDGNGSEILGVNDPAIVRKVKSMRLMFMVNCKNISFDGILLKDAASWNTHILGCEDITFRNCKLMNNLVNNEFMGSLDGWDPDASKRVLIENCFGWAGDDNVAVKCTGFGTPKILKDVEDITVRGCVFLTKKSSLKIGTETRCDSYKRILFENNDIVEADRVMGINVRDKAIVDGVLFKNNRSEYSFPDRKQTAINIYITHRLDDQPWTGKIQNVTIEDCSFEQKFPKKIQITRLENFTKKEDLQVTFKNLTIEKKKINSLDSNYFNLSKCNGVIQFKCAGSKYGW